MKNKKEPSYRVLKIYKFDSRGKLVLRVDHIFCNNEVIFKNSENC